MYNINMNEQNVTFDWNFFADDIDGSCIINFPFILVNSTGPLSYKDFDDVILLGSQAFKSFQGI